jgi:hypothetical protein
MHLLLHHPCSDVDKLRVKPRNFKFNPVRGWLGGTMTEKVEGWKCTVYEATGKVGVLHVLHVPHVLRVAVECSMYECVLM